MRADKIFKNYGYICSIWKEGQARNRSWDEIVIILDALWEVYSEEGAKSISEYLFFLARVADVHANTVMEERLELKMFHARQYLMSHPI